MKSRYFGKWTALCAVLAVVAASGQACPPEMPLPAPSLAGLWSGSISGDGTTNIAVNGIVPLNPHPGMISGTNRIASNLQIVFTDAGLPTTLPLMASAFFIEFEPQAVTVFNVGEMETISSSFIITSPEGAADLSTFEISVQTTLTVVESVLTPDHFRVVYATTNVQDISQTSTDPMFSPVKQLISSTGTLTFDATAVGGAVMFSMDFNNNGSIELTQAGNMPTGNGFAVGSLTGTLAAD
jgi:hypothetical protein